jgi:hypothetical protein
MQSQWLADIIAQLYKDPGSLTKDQAERLMASPAFLSRLAKLTGQPINVNPTGSDSDDKGKGRKRARNTLRLARRPLPPFSPRPHRGPWSQHGHVLQMPMSW